MAGFDRPQNLRRLRLGLLLFFWVGVGGLIVWMLWSLREAGEAGSFGSPVPSASPLVSGLSALVSSEGFQFEHLKGGRLLFRLWGERFQVDREGWVSIDGVRVEFHGEERSFELRGKRGQFRETDRAAVVEGDVELSSSDGLRFRGNRVRLESGGGLLEMEGPISMEGIGFRGEAGALELQFERRQLRISQGAVFESSEPGPFGMRRVKAGEIVWLEPEAQLQLLGDVELAGGWGSLTCGRGFFFLDPKTRKTRSVLLQWEIHAETQAADFLGGSGSARKSLKWQTEELRADLSPGESMPSQVTLEARIGEQVRLMEPLPDGRVREVASRFMVVEFREGVARQATAFQPVHLSEYVSDSRVVERRGRAEMGVLEFGSTGEGQRVVLQGNVQLELGASRLQSERAWFDFATEDFEALGEPASLADSRGEFWAPRIFRQGRRGVTQATGGVRAVLVPEAWRELVPDFQAGGPIRVEAREAVLTEIPQSLFFQGNVQAWQQNSVLFSDRLQLETAPRRLTASGGVRTLWSWAKSGSPEAQTEPVELAANALSYNPDLRRLEYLGQVKGRQNGRTLKAQELILELNQERQPERYLAQGEVVLREPERQLEIQAERGEHFPSTGLARFGGQRVLLREPRGVVEGKALEYNLKTGIARWLGGQRP